jgi:hypothetical protein
MQLQACFTGCPASTATAPPRFGPVVFSTGRAALDERWLEPLIECKISVLLRWKGALAGFVDQSMNNLTRFLCSHRSSV